MSFTLGSYVSARRKTLGLVQQKIADSLHYTVQSISSFESGESQLALSAMPELANCLELSIDDLFLETPNAPRIQNANSPFNSALFAQNLATLRKQKSLSQKEAADRLKISLRSLTNYEKGHTLPSLEIAQTILSVYDVKASALFYSDLSLPVAPRKTYKFPIRILLPAILVILLGLAVGIPLVVSNKNPSNSPSDSSKAASFSASSLFNSTPTSSSTSNAASSSVSISSSSTSSSNSSSSSSSPSVPSSSSTSSSNSSSSSSSPSVPSSSSTTLPSSSSQSEPDIDPNFPGLKKFYFVWDDGSPTAGEDRAVSMDILPAGYFNEGNATLTYGFAKNYYNVYWDSPALPEDVHHFHVDEHLSDQTKITLTFTAERNGHTIVRTWTREITNHLTGEKDFNSEYFPGLSHYYYTIGGLDEVTLPAGSTFTFDSPTFKTYRSAMPKDYSSTTLYQHLPNSSNEVVSLRWVSETIIGTVSNLAQSGDVCYFTAFIRHLLYTNEQTDGDYQHLKVIVQ